MRLIKYEQNNPEELLEYYKILASKFPEDIIENTIRFTRVLSEWGVGKGEIQTLINRLDEYIQSI